MIHKATFEGLLRDCEDAITRPLRVIGILPDSESFSDVEKEEDEDDASWNRT